MGKNTLIPALAVICGGVGYALRRWQLRAGFEPDTGLDIPGAPPAVALVVLTLAVAALLVALCWRNKERMDWRRAFPAQGNVLFMTAMALAAFLLLGSAVLEVVGLSGSFQMADHAETAYLRTVGRVIPVLRIAFSALGFPSVLLWGRALYRNDGKGEECLGLPALALLYCVWLVSNYQVQNSEPVVMRYLYEVLAVVSALMALYYLAGYSFQKEGKPRRATVLCLLGVYFSMVTLADAHSLAEICRYGFAVVFLTAHAALLLGEHPAGEPVETEETEADENA